MILDDDAPRKAAAEAVRVGGEAGPKFILLLAKYVWKTSGWGFILGFRSSIVYV